MTEAGRPLNTSTSTTTSTNAGALRTSTAGVFARTAWALEADMAAQDVG